MAIKQHHICKKDEEDKFGLSRRELKVLNHTLDQSLLIAILNDEGVFQYINRQFCEVSKYDKNELIGENLSILDSGCHSKKFFEKM